MFLYLVHNGQTTWWYSSLLLYSQIADVVSQRVRERKESTVRWKRAKLAWSPSDNC